ncbi:MAG: hypothetical protein ACYCPQ_04190 [Elusimicrobiota bacterium]
MPISLEKRITRNFSLRLDSQYLSVSGPAVHASGWNAMGLQAKYLFYENDPHEIFTTFILRATTPTGAGSAGQGNPLTVYSYLVFNKGMGDLPVSWIRPFAIQTDIAGIAPFGSGPQPLSPYVGLADFGDAFRFDGALEYSLLYLHDVVGAVVPAWLRPITPAVEVRTLVNLSSGGHEGATAGYLSYELNYQAPKYQLSLAYQEPYGFQAPFVGRQWLLYVTFYYGWILRDLGFHATPF